MGVHLSMATSNIPSALLVASVMVVYGLALAVVVLVRRRGNR